MKHHRTSGGDFTQNCAVLHVLPFLKSMGSVRAFQGNRFVGPFQERCVNHILLRHGTYVLRAGTLQLPQKCRGNFLGSFTLVIVLQSTELSSFAFASDFNCQIYQQRCGKLLISGMRMSLAGAVNTNCSLGFLLPTRTNVLV